MVQKVVNDNAINYIKTVPEDSVDLIILDPDYQKWEEYLEQGLLEESIRALKHSGNILCFTKQPFDYKLRIAANDYFRREIIWSFENGGAWVSNRMPLVSFQKIYWLTKSDSFYFEPRTGVKYNKNTKDFKRSSKVFEGYCEEGKRFQKSDNGIWIRDHLHFNKPNCGKIPAKPKELIDIFLKCFCPNGGTVLDLFSGSGVIVQVARENRLNCKAVELNPDRADKIKEMLNQPIQLSIFDYLRKEGEA